MSRRLFSINLEFKGVIEDKCRTFEENKRKYINSIMTAMPIYYPCVTEDHAELLDCAEDIAALQNNKSHVMVG